MSDVKGRAMRMAELSRRSGVQIATIKFYVREGVLHPGRSTAVNQAEYDDTHLDRLRLVRALADAGRLSLAQIADVVRAVDDDVTNLHDAFAVAQDAMARPALLDDADHPSARAEADDLVAELGWRVRDDAVVRDLLADAIVLLRRHGSPYPDLLRSMAAAAVAQAEFEIDSVDDTSRSSAVEFGVLGTIAYEAAAAAMRRLALEHQSARRWGGNGHHRPQ
jgi:DNA-binding transcriptional MerR regulator